jgi:hypothetical protein
MHLQEGRLTGEVKICIRKIHDPVLDRGDSDETLALLSKNEESRETEEILKGGLHHVQVTMSAPPTSSPGPRIILA